METFTELVPTGTLEGRRRSGVVPTLVVNSLLIPYVLCSPPASEDPLKSDLPVPMSCGNTSCFVRFTSENTAQRNKPTTSWCQIGGGEYHSSLLPPPLPPPCLLAFLTVLNFLFDLVIKSLLFLGSDVCWVWLGKWLAEEDVWENVPEQAITFDKAIVPAGAEEES